MDWSVYIIICSNDSLYTGITTNTEKRFAQHKTGKGAKYFRRCQPIRLVILETGLSRSNALKREAVIKKMPHHLKKTLIPNSPAN